MNTFHFRADQVVDELVQFNQNLSKGVKNLLEADEISRNYWKQTLVVRTSGSNLSPSRLLIYPRISMIRGSAKHLVCIP